MPAIFAHYIFGAEALADFAAPMRQMVVPQSGHLPFVMGLPFFVTPSTGSFIIFFALHFTQYASIAIVNLSSSCIRAQSPRIGERTFSSCSCGLKL